MTDDDATVRVRRIVAAFPGRGDTGPLLRLAARLAELCRAELSAVLVEDQALLQLARLPVARHFVSATGTTEMLTPEVLRLAMRASLRRTEVLMARTIASPSLTWTLQMAGGNGTVIAGEDFLLLSARVAYSDEWMGRALGDPQRVAALALDNGSWSDRVVAVVHDGSSAGARAFSLALLFAGAQHVGCHVLLPAPVRDLQPEIEAAMASAEVAYDITIVEALDPPVVATWARACHAGLLVTPATMDTIRRLHAELAESDPHSDALWR